MNRSIAALALGALAAGCTGQITSTSEGGVDGSAPDLATVAPLDLAKSPDDLAAPDDDGSVFGPLDLSPARDLAVTDIAQVVRPDMALPSTCTSPTPLSLGGGSAQVSGDTRTSTPTQQGSCGGNGREIAYSITVASPSILSATVTASALTPAYQPIVYLRDSCTDGSIQHELACSKPSGSPATSRLSAVLAPGTYDLFVDGKDGSVGAFTLSATLTAAPAAPANDTCATAAALTFDMTGHAQVTGDLSGAKNDGQVECGGSRGADVMYTFTLAKAANFAAALAADATTPGFVPILELRKACTDPSTALGCDQTDIVGGVSMVNVPGLAAGTYSLWVDGLDATPGRFTLDAWTGTAPTNDACGTPSPITLVSGAADLAVSTLLAKDDAISFSCAGQAPDVVYSLTLTQASSVTAWVTPSTPGWRPVVYVRSICANGGQSFEQACGGGLDFGPPKLLAPSLMPGTYAIWVDGYRGTFGKGTLSVRVGAPMAPAANDTCTSPQLLDLSTGSATVTVDTRGAGGNATGSCGGGTASDLVYSFTLAAAQKVTVSVKANPSTPEWHPVVFARSTCDQTNTQLACDSRYSDMAGFTLLNQKAGTYAVWVDGLNTTSGLGTLTVSTGPPVTAPANSGCTKPSTLVAGTPITADTTGANNAFGAKLNPLCDPSGFGAYKGPDLFYVYTPTVDGTATFSLAPDPSFDAALFVVPAMCVADGSTCTAGSDAAGNGSEELLTMAVTGGVPYFVVVDAALATQAGPFTLSVK